MAPPSAAAAALIGDLPAMQTAGRLGRLREAMAPAHCEALLVTDRANIRYLSGFTGSAGALLVLRGEAVLVTDGRYALQAPEEVARWGADISVEVRPAVAQPELLAQLCRGLRGVGLEADHVSWGLQHRWAGGWASEHQLVPTTGLVEGLRRVKDAGEVARVRAAAAIADAALTAVAGLLDQSVSEVELSLALDFEMRRLGAEAPAFDTIVAFGPNAAEPHHRPTSRRLGQGEVVLADFGARFEGYCSDMTRVTAVGDVRCVPAELRRAAAVVLAAQDAGLSALCDGVPAAEVDRACREVVAAAGLGDLFVHGTGHGVGLDIHEAPSVAAASDDILASGQVVTVEPGVYIPGLGGARTEDTVVVTDAGCQILTMTPKDGQASL